MPESKFDSGDSARSDAEFLRAFEDLSFPADLFHHREHIRVAWLYLRSSDATRAAERMSEGIRRFANNHGATQKYHHTLTLAWMRLVAAALVETPEGYTFEQFITAHPQLKDTKLLGKYYSTETLQTAAAREAWVEPDLQPLPDLRIYRCC
jgi:2'-5' RNA ligase